MTSTPCPDCRTPLSGAATCLSCGLRLTGPAAVRLWEVDQAIVGLQLERVGLLAALRGASPMVALPPIGPEWTPQRVQNALLGVGGLLLAVAGVVFAAVTYDRLGAGGRAVVLLLLTLAAGAAVPQLLRRGLTATAETVCAVALALAALDAYGLRTFGLAAGSSGLAYAAGSCGALAGTAGAFARLVPVRLPRVAGVLLAQLPVPLLLADTGADAGTWGVAFALLAAADAGAVILCRGDVRRTALGSAAVSAVLALIAGGTGAYLPDGRAAGSVALLLLAGLAALAGLRLSGLARLLAHAAPAPLVAAAAACQLDGPLVLIAVALLGVQAAALLPVAHRSGPVAGAAATAIAAVATQAEQVAQAALLPLLWLQQPWSRTAAGARATLPPDQAWDGTATTLVVVVGATVVTVAAGLALHRLRTALPVAAALAVVAAVLLPLGLGTTYAVALVLLLVLTAGLLTGGTVLRRTDVSLACLAAGTGTALQAGVWATADRNGTLLVLPVLAVLLAGAATRRPALAAAAGTTSGAAVAAAGAAAGLHADQVGGLLLLVPAALVGLTRIDRPRRLPYELAAAVLAGTTLVLASTDVGWLSWVLAGSGLLATGVAVHRDRRPVAVAGALLLSASSWVRLLDAGVSAPEPYVVPIALVALGFGHLRRRREPAVRSFAAYGPGLSALLLPSLLASLTGGDLTRPLLLAVAATAVVLIGASERLQAPLLLGGGVLVLDALHLLAPYAAALPRWSTLGVTGLLLLAVGATYEQRRRDLTRVRDLYDALA
jgi:hypothetical protein